MSKAILDFAAKVNAKLTLDYRFIVEKEDRYFLLNDELKIVARQDLFYAGLYLGKLKKGKFFPSFNLLSILAEKKANQVVVDEKAAWLFICGRDIFGAGITAVRGSRRKGDFTLVVNVFGECLGFGRIIQDLNSKGSSTAIQNVSDVGDFLRRER